MEALEAAQQTLDEEYQTIQSLMVEVGALATVKSKGEMDPESTQSGSEVSACRLNAPRMFQKAQAQIKATTIASLGFKLF